MLPLPLLAVVDLLPVSQYMTMFSPAAATTAAAAVGGATCGDGLPQPLLLPRLLLLLPLPLLLTQSQHFYSSLRQHERLIGGMPLPSHQHQQEQQQKICGRQLTLSLTAGRRLRSTFQRT
jgi:hypothetical protein